MKIWGRYFLCWVWTALLILGLNYSLDMISPGLLLSILILFAVWDLLLGWAAILGKVATFLVILQRYLYGGPFFSLDWLGWLGLDVYQELARFPQAGIEPVLGLALTLIVALVIQQLFYAFVFQGKGIITLLFTGAALLAGMSYLHPGSAYFVAGFVGIGIVIMSIVRLPIQQCPNRYLSRLLVLVICLVIVAWVLPSGELDWRHLYSHALSTWQEITQRELEAPTPSVGYRQQGALGGPVQGDSTHVMTVTSPRPVYLVGETYSYYSGRGWQRKNLNFVPFTNQVLDHPGEVITVEVLPHYPSSAGVVLFVPRFALTFESSPNQVWAVDAGDYGFTEFIGSNRLQAGEAYTMIVLVPDDDPDLLRPLTTTGAEEYLQLPGDLPQRVKDLATELTAGLENGYDKAKALVDYLKGGKWSYSLSTELAPAGEDFVDWFLFEQDRGYCAHFSSAFVVLARAAGLPARWVKGYGPGVPQGNRYKVTNSNAHAWGEVWFDDYGWVPFEPTPGVDATDVEPVERSEPVISDVDPVRPSMDGTSKRSPSAFIAIVLSGAVLLFFTRCPRNLKSLYQRIQLRLWLFGWQRQAWETPREHLQRIKLPRKELMSRFVGQFEADIYGGVENAEAGKEASKFYSLLRLTYFRLTRR